MSLQCDFAVIVFFELLMQQHVCADLHVQVIESTCRRLLGAAELQRVFLA